MSKPSFVYTTYVNASAEAVWSGLLEPEFTRQYWYHDNVSDWKVGSRWEHVQVQPEVGQAPWPVEPGKVDVTGEVVESEPPLHLVLTWARPGEEDNPERTSRLAFDLERLDWPGGPWTKLVVAHTDLDDEMAAGVSQGWPMVVSAMKTLVERAHPPG